MAKPICIVKYDFDNFSIDGRVVSADELMTSLQQQMPDYYVFAIPVHSAAEIISFQVFHEKDFTEVQYEELKKIIHTAINQQ